MSVEDVEPNGDTVVYLAGKMTGLPDYNFPTFNAVAEKLRELGFVVINPAETAGGVDHLPREWFMRFDYNVIDNVDAVVVLPSWTESQGAKGEVLHASEIGVPVHWYDPLYGLGPRIEVLDIEVNYITTDAYYDEVGL